MKWDEYVEMIKEYGFKVVFQREIGVISNKRPTLLVAAHPEKFLLLRADSYVSSGIEYLNKSSVYGETEAIGQKRVQLSHTQPDFSITDKTFEFECKITTDGLIDALNKIEAISRFIKWRRPDKPVWLTDYSHSHKDWKEYYNDFVSMAPDWVLDFILPNSKTPETSQ